MKSRRPPPPQPAVQVWVLTDRKGQTHTIRASPDVAARIIAIAKESGFTAQRADIHPPP